MVSKAKVKKPNAAIIGRVQKDRSPQFLPLPTLDNIKVANVRYFLTLLNQISRALRALGYPAEGQVLAQVKTDLEYRIFSASQNQRDFPTMLQ